MGMYPLFPIQLNQRKAKKKKLMISPQPSNVSWNNFLMNITNIKKLSREFQKRVFILICCWVIPGGEGTEDADSDVLVISFLTRIKQKYTRNTTTTTSRAATAPPIIAATFLFFGLLLSWPSCSVVRVGTLLSPLSLVDALSLFSSLKLRSCRWIEECGGKTLGLNGDKSSILACRESVQIPGNLLKHKVLRLTVY